MKPDHKAILCLGSNINPEINLLRAIELLAEHGTVYSHSSAWESPAMGSVSPNYLNACLVFLTSLDEETLREKVIRPIETKLGRIRSSDMFAPRTIDIDLVMFDDVAHKEEYWNRAYFLIPLSQIEPEINNPLSHETARQSTERIRSQSWIRERTDVMKQKHGSNLQRSSAS